MRVKFLGDQDVDVPELGQTVPAGGTVDVPDDIGARMMQNSLWEAAGDQDTEPEQAEVPATEEV